MYYKREDPMKTAGAFLLAVILSACSDAMTSTAPPPPPPTAITVAYCAPYTPLWVAFQDGDGPWTRAQPTVAGGSTQFSYSFSSSRGAIATVIQGGLGLTSLAVLDGTPQELTTVSLDSPRFCGSPLRTLHGTVAGLDTNELAVLQSGFITEDVVHAGEAFTLNQVLPGPRDILATRITRSNGMNVLSKMILRHGIDLPDGATLPVFDFATAEAFAPATANVTLNVVGSDGAFVTVGLLTNNFLNTFFIPQQLMPGLVQPFLAIPEAQGEAVKAIVVKAAGADPMPDELIAFARERVAGFKCPKTVDFIDALPRNPSGKILKTELREPYWKGRQRRVN